MKRQFEIEFPDEYGEMWMNKYNLQVCIDAYCKNKDGRIKVSDIASKPELILECCGRPESQCKCDDVDVASLRLQTRTSSLKPISEQELREKIARLLFDCEPRGNETWDSTTHRHFYWELAGQILALIKDAGYVKLAKDQRIKENPYPMGTKDDCNKRTGYFRGQADMLNAGWRKVEVEKDANI